MMELQLLDKKCKLVEKPVVGGYYAVGSNEMVFRAVLESIDSDGTATVYDIDGGEREKVPLDTIYELEDKCYDLEPQVDYRRKKLNFNSTFL